MSVESFDSDGVKLGDGRVRSRRAPWCGPPACGPRSSPHRWPPNARGAAGWWSTSACGWSAIRKCAPSATSPRPSTLEATSCRWSRRRQCRRAATWPPTSSGERRRGSATATRATSPRSGVGPPSPRSDGCACGASSPGLTWLVVHIYYLIGFENRAAVMLRWSWYYVRYERPVRAVIRSSGAAGPTGDRVDPGPTRRRLASLGPERAEARRPVSEANKRQEA